MEPGRKDREHTGAGEVIVKLTEASMEPGHKDREHIPTERRLHYLVKLASMEPGRKDREHERVRPVHD